MYICIKLLKKTCKNCIYFNFFLCVANGENIFFSEIAKNSIENLYVYFFLRCVRITLYIRICVICVYESCIGEEGGKPRVKSPLAAVQEMRGHRVRHEPRRRRLGSVVPCFRKPKVSKL